MGIDAPIKAESLLRSDKSASLHRTAQISITEYFKNATSHGFGRQWGH
jgi:hypothetical protein